MNEDLKNYVEQERKKGVSDEEIAKALISQGWTIDRLSSEQAFGEIESKPKITLKQIIKAEENVLERIDYKALIALWVIILPLSVPLMILMPFIFFGGPIIAIPLLFWLINLTFNKIYYTSKKRKKLQEEVFYTPESKKKRSIKRVIFAISLGVFVGFFALLFILEFKVEMTITITVAIVCGFTVTLITYINER